VTNVVLAGPTRADAALRFALDEAEPRGADLDVVHAWADPDAGPHPGVWVPRAEIEHDASRILDESLLRALEGRRDLRVAVHARLVEGAPVKARPAGCEPVSPP
jgi:hypothetical protein